MSTSIPTSNQDGDLRIQRFCDAVRYITHVWYIQEEWEISFSTVGSRSALVLPIIAGTVASSLANDVLLGISRLTDPPEHRGFRHLSIDRMMQLSAQSPQRKRLKDLRRQIEANAKCVRAVRMQELAHADETTSLTPLAKIETECVRSIIECLQQFCGLLEAEYGRTWETRKIDIEVEGRHFRRLLNGPIFDRLQSFEK